MSSAEDSENAFTDFENPNYRKLYATLSLTSMIGSGPKLDDPSSRIEDKSDIEGGSNNENHKEDESGDLPAGWEKHEDDSGAYYWHIPSGTIQRQLPTSDYSKRHSMIYYEEEDNTENNDDNRSTINLKSVHSFVVNSLGWLHVEEKQFTPELSPATIQKCIIELNSKEAAAIWGKQETQKLLLKIENACFKLLDLNSGKLLDIQPITSIRVWGVMNDDFAYAARDSRMLDSSSLQKDYDGPDAPSSPVSTPPATSTLKCHVFHCEIDDKGQNTAQKISDIVKAEMTRIKLQRSQDEQQNKIRGSKSAARLRNGRPSTLNLKDSDSEDNSNELTPALFHTPIEEPRKTVQARYLGKCVVPKPFGVDVLNSAIDKILVAPENSDEPYCGSTVLAHISPSTIVLEHNDMIVTDFRVRYLSFLAISQANIKLCGFIVQVDDKTYEAHAFECDQSAGPLCKTIEAACKLRFQKCLDAHQQRKNMASEKRKSFTSPIANLKSSVVNAFSKLMSR